MNTRRATLFLALVLAVSIPRSAAGSTTDAESSASEGSSAQSLAPDSLFQKAKASFNVDRNYAAAESLALLALPGLEREHGPFSHPVAMALDIAFLSQQLGDFMSAKTESLAARAVAARRHDPDTTNLIQTLLQAGWVYENRARLREARAWGEEALALMLTHTPKDTTRLIRVHELLGLTAGRLQDRIPAAAHWREAIALKESSPKRRRSLAYYYFGLGATLRGREGDRDAIELFDRGLAIAETSVPPDTESAIRILTGQVDVLTRTKDLARASAVGRRAVEWADAQYGAWSMESGFARNNVARSLIELGDYDEARRQAEMAVAIWKSAAPLGHEMRHASLVTAAQAFRAAGVLDSAEARLRDAVHETTYGLGPGNPYTLQAEVRLANVRARRGRAAPARASLDSIEAIVSRIDPVWQPSILAEIAETRGLLGNRERAERLFFRASALQDSVYGPRSLASHRYRSRLSEALYDMGRRPEAFAAALGVQGDARDMLRTAASELSERETLQFQEVLSQGNDLLLTLASGPSGDSSIVSAAWDALARSRLIVLEELTERQRALRSEDAAASRERTELGVARDSLARLLVLALERTKSDSLDAAVAQARRRREAAERALGSVNATYRARREHREGGLATALSALPANAALIAYARYSHRLDFARADSTGAHVEQRYLAFVKPKGGGQSAVVPLGAAGEIERLATEWRRLCERPIAATDKRSWQRLRRVGADLRARIWDPIQPLLDGASRLYVVPDGMVATINIVALPVGADAWLLERGPVIQMIGAERDLAPESARRMGHGLLALGAPSFDRGPALPSLADPAPDVLTLRSRLNDASGLSLAPLPGSRDEVNDIRALWSKISSDPGDSAVALVGSEATEEAFKRSAPGRRILHLATHGVSLADRNVRFERGARGVLGLASSAAPSMVREQLAALALSGATHSGVSDAKDDGWLTNEEVLGMNLEGVEWAVLSACATGSADPHAVEMIQGLHRAFRAAGVRTVISSLWPVSDRATREWMVRLYRARWVEEKSTADAARSASLGMLAERRERRESTHPFYWAAFVCVGMDRE